jgi:predicted kinase
MGTPTLILVTGPAGSGKTTLAHALATAVGCPALCRDEIKEGMVASNPGFVPATSDPLTMRTYQVFVEVIALLLRAEVTLVAEAAFQHPLWVRSLEPVQDLAELRVVRCRVSDEVARRRQLDRMTSQATRAAHADAEHLTTALTFDAIHIDAPTLDVDTADGWRPELAQIAAFCLQQNPSVDDPARE